MGRSSKAMFMDSWERSVFLDHSWLCREGYIGGNCPKKTHFLSSGFIFLSSYDSMHPYVGINSTEFNVTLMSQQTCSSVTCGHAQCMLQSGWHLYSLIKYIKYHSISKLLVIIVRKIMNLQVIQVLISRFLLLRFSP